MRNLTRDLPACRVVPHPTAPLRAQLYIIQNKVVLYFGWHNTFIKIVKKNG